MHHSVALFRLLERSGQQFFEVIPCANTPNMQSLITKANTEREAAPSLHQKREAQVGSARSHPDLYIAMNCSCDIKVKNHIRGTSLQFYREFHVLRKESFDFTDCRHFTAAQQRGASMLICRLGLRQNADVLTRRPGRAVSE